MGLFYYFRFVSMNVNYKILITLYFLLFACSFQAQNVDTLSSTNLIYDSILTSDSESMNTLFYKHQNDVLLNNLGPYGSPFYYPTAHYLYKYSLIDKVDSYNLKFQKLLGIKPYTNITYINASRKEQQFSIKHFQQFGKLLVLDFDFIKISSPGAYKNQEANSAIFTGTLTFHNRKDNYEIKFSNGINRKFYDENGGLYDIKNYEFSLYDDERSYPVNLESSNSFIKRYTYQLKQRMDIFKIASDSLGTKTIYLKHNIQYTTKQKVFYDNDPLSKIYKEIYLDTISSVDSIFSKSLNNIGSIGIRTPNFSFELFAQYDQKLYLQNSWLNNNYHNTYFGFQSNYQSSKIGIDAIAKYGFDGYTKGNIESDMAIDYDHPKYKICAGLSYFLTEPDLNYKYYTSNHFIWYNANLKKQSLLGFHLNLNMKRLKMEFSVESKLLNNTLYFDSLAIANQDLNTASISTFSLAKNYKLLNFYFRTAFIYQLTSDRLLFPLPEMIGRQILYYQKYIFKGALKFQFGVGFSYSTEYYGYAYMPALTEYYVQGNTRLGHYPKIDIFINTHLKRAQIFLKYEHYNAGKSIYKSYAVPGYPPMSRSLKFGVSWNMFD
jgi:hypothetical protein